MNDQTSKLLEQLAAKLGTTVEYLWSVLVKQAMITAYIDIVYIILMSAFLLIYYKTGRWCIRIIQKDENEESCIASVIWLIIGGIISIIMFICIFCDISEMITCFLNPEYWALEKVLDTTR